MKPMNNQIQQGDVLFEKIDLSDLPANAKMLEQGENLIVATGEASGHSHILKGLATKYQVDEPEGNIYFQVKEQTWLAHEEHGPVRIEPGIYRFNRVREYDYFAKMSRQVAD